MRVLVRTSRNRSVDDAARRVAFVTATVMFVAIFTFGRPPAASAATIATVSPGLAHTCAVTTSGGVRCWGRNADGQLGNGTTTDSSIPVNVAGLSSGVLAVSSGADDSCALTMAGGVQCWGVRVGTGVAGAKSAVPVTPLGLGSGVRAVSVGWDVSCALMQDATVRCWGSNSRGQLGDGGATQVQYAPATVPGLTGVVAVSAGGVHVCALLEGGTVKCWGYNAYGQVGNGSMDAAGVFQPTDVVGLSNVTAIEAGGYHSCAITSSGGAVCWGQDQSGQLGDGANQNSATPVAVSGLSSGVASLAGGEYHTCAITTSGGAMCWGANVNGALGDGTTNNSSVPIDVPGQGANIASISGGRWITCSIDTSSRLRCWGWNLYGQVGNGTTSNAVLNPTPVAWFAASFSVSCTGLVCNASDTSTDPGGEIATRTWSFGDGGAATGTTVTHTYAAGGSYAVSLTAADGGGVTSTATRSVTVTPWNLRASVSKVRGSNVASLTWNAAATASASIDVLRNGVRVAATTNGGSYSETLSKKGTFSYVVCPTGSSVCSNVATVTA